MAADEPNVRPDPPEKECARSRPPFSQRQLLLNSLSGIPERAPALPEALALREAGWSLVVAYCRISDDRHRKDGHGVADQAQHCARIAAQHRMIVIRRYVDNDKPASKVGVERPEFEAMLEALRLGVTEAGYPIDGVVCVSDDRLYRDIHTYQRFLGCFIAHPFRRYADGLGSYDLHSPDAAQRGLLGASAARAESAKQQHRARLSHRARAERGEPVAGRRPFGWNADKVTLHPGESDVVRRGVQSLLQGKTLTGITQDFVGSGYKSTLGNPWQRQTVKQILRNPRICGYRKLDGVLVRGDDGTPVLGRWESIVSPEEWHRVTELLEGQRHSGGWARTGTRRGEAAYLLSGLVRCGRPTANGRQCGAPMHGHPTRTSYEYRCRGALDGGCGRLSRQGPAVDTLITEQALIRLKLQGTPSGWLAPTWPGIRELEIAKQRKAALQERWYAGEISDSGYFARLKHEESEIKRLVNEQQRWLILHHHGAHPIGNISAYWKGLGADAKLGVLHGLLESVTILPGTKGSHRFDPTAIVPQWRTALPETRIA